MSYEDFSAKDFANDLSFIRWVKGSDAECEWFWQSFMKEYPAKVKEMEEARKLINVLVFRNDELSQEAFESMRDRLTMAIYAERKKEQDISAPYNFTKRNSVAWKYWLKVAAAVTVPLICISIIYYSVISTKSVPEIIKNQTISPNEERINPRGQKSVLLLADGTKVWLNADSRLNYSKDFNKNTTREVYLDGEAYFDVVSDPSKPFIVHTSAINIKVLGTKFNVKSYGDDETIETTLVHGKVSINKVGDDLKDGRLILKPNQKAIFLKNTNTLNIEEVAADRTTAWRHDRLVFDETAFEDVVAQLERWYNVKIHIESDSDLQCRLTADIEKESLQDVLTLLAASSQISYSIAGNDVFIKGALCK